MVYIGDIIIDPNTINPIEDSHIRRRLRESDENGSNGWLSRKLAGYETD